MILHLIRPYIASAGLVLGALIAARAACGQARAARQLEIAVQDDPVFLGDGYRLDRERVQVPAGARRDPAARQPRLGDGDAATPVQGASQAPPRSTGVLRVRRDGRRRGGARIRVHAALTGPAPVWASGNRKLRGGVRRALRGVAGIVAKHFKGRIDRYSIWNEPNWRTWLQPLKSGPRLYRDLYTRGYAAIKRADRRAKVLIGETSPYQRRACRRRRSRSCARWPA